MDANLTQAYETVSVTVNVRCAIVRWLDCNFNYLCFSRHGRHCPHKHSIKWRTRAHVDYYGRLADWLVGFGAHEDKTVCQFSMPLMSM